MVAEVTRSTLSGVSHHLNQPQGYWESGRGDGFPTEIMCVHPTDQGGVFVAGFWNMGKSTPSLLCAGDTI